MPRKSAESKRDYNVLQYTSGNRLQAQYCMWQTVLDHSWTLQGYLPSRVCRCLSVYAWGCSRLGEQNYHKINFCVHTGARLLYEWARQWTATNAVAGSYVFHERACIVYSIQRYWRELHIEFGVLHFVFLWAWNTINLRARPGSRAQVTMTVRRYSRIECETILQSFRGL